MNALLNLFVLLAIPFTVLNIFGGIVSGIWIAILGDWGSIGYGLLAIIISIFVLGMALMPSLLLAAPGAYFAEKGIMSLFYVFAFLSVLYIVAVMTAWCGGVLYFFAGRATRESVIPVLIWSYGVALGPWQWMTQKDVQGGGGEGSIATTIFAQFGYVVMILMALFGNATIVDVLTVFVIIMLVGIVFQFALAIQVSRATKLGSLDHDETPDT